MKARPTTIRLDQTTLDRIAKVKAFSPVAVSFSAVVQEAIRRGLAEMESEWDTKEATPCKP